MIVVEQQPEQRRKPILTGKHSQFSIVQRKDGVVVTVGSTIISVETAKRPRKEWKPKLRDDIETARASYHVMWGGVPAWDYYDRLDTTYNYIAYVQYPTPHGDLAMEVLSNRLVLDDPEDLKFYRYESVPLNSVLPDLLRIKKGYNPRIMAGESRIGSIRPAHLSANAHTMEAFAAIKLVMVKDARRAGVDYLACQLRKEMPRTVFTVGDITYDFPRTEDLLGVQPGTIKLDRRSREVVSHITNYPGYFLDTTDVHKIMRELVGCNELPLQEFKQRTGLSSVDDLLKPRNIKSLVPVITLDNPLGALLKSRLLRETKDGTYSSIAHVDYIEEMVINLLRRMAGLESSKAEVVR